jgi:alpha-L-fucosidase
VTVILNRRQALKSITAAAALAGSAKAANTTFQPNWESLQQYRCPEWFRNAKFGIWAHWGPQCGPRQGDWYARNMYIQGSRQNKFHVAKYGHPSQFGYKNVIPFWTAHHWEPETLIRRYKKAGARYFVSLGAHCDNFDCWNSKHHRWNAVNFGPRHDVVGAWRHFAREHNLRFGVTEHLAWTYDWFNVNKGADLTGPYSGVPYDGNDPRFQDLYHEPHPEHQASYPLHPSERFQTSWFNRVKDLIDQNQPDLVYTDGGAFGQVGLDLIAHYYNANMDWHKGVLDGVYTIKNQPPKSHIGDFQPGATSLDVERGVVADIWPEPFQTDTCIGNWFYYDGIEYKKPSTVIHTLIDVVSKNGNLLLNFPLLPDGTLDSKEESILEEITQWMAVHGEAIFDTRPWTRYGEGPTKVVVGLLTEKNQAPYSAQDIRFTTKQGKLYVFCLGWPTEDVVVSGAPESLTNVRLLGSDEKLRWTLSSGSLRITAPVHKTSEYAIVFALTV